MCTIEYLDVDSTSTSGKERTVRPSVGFFFFHTCFRWVKNGRAGAFMLTVTTSQKSVDATTRVLITYDWNTIPVVQYNIENPSIFLDTGCNLERNYS